MAREKVMAVRRKGGRPGKIECPLESKWSKYPAAINGVHFKTVYNNQVRQTHGKGFLCLIMDRPGLCQNFAKKMSFLQHFRTHHQLNLEPIKRGRPAKAENTRRVLSNDAQQRADKRLKGDFVAKVWRAKKTHLGIMVNWAITMQQGCPNEKDVTDWIWDLAMKRYEEWRKDSQFTESIIDIAKRTKAYWKGRNANFSRQEIQKKVLYVSILVSITHPVSCVQTRHQLGVSWKVGFNHA